MEDGLIPGKVKLRSSCDRCGAAKLKCDRGQPECGRCRSLGQICVYGLSRKGGKVRRAKQVEHKVDELQQAISSLSGQGTSTVLDIFNDNSEQRGNDIIMNSDQLPNHDRLLWSAIQNNNTGITTSLDSTDATLGPFEFDEYSFPTHTDDNVLSAPIIPTALPLESSYHFNQDPVASNNRKRPLEGDKQHNCPQEAYNILSSLSTPIQGQVVPDPRYSESLPATPDNCVSLDQVLHINHQAMERLKCLLACSCSRSPHLALVYASIISRILIWYQQAVGCNQSASWNSIATIETDSSATSTLASVSASRSGSAVPPSSNTAPTLAEVTGLMVAATSKMAIGSYSIDDPHVLTVAKKQLVLSEMKKLESLLDLFEAQNYSNSNKTAKHSFGGVDSLYESLAAWLRAEHSRIVSIMQSKLKELGENNLSD